MMKRGNSKLIQAIKKLEFADAERVVICSRQYRGWKLTDEERCAQLGDFDSFKPPGMWWSCGPAWIDWCLSEQPDWLGKYIYSVKVDESKILRITDIEGFEAFEQEYGTANCVGLTWQGKRFRGDIDWQKVREQYSGIEITPYYWEKRFNSLWYYTWDVASGCLWDKTALLERTLIYSYKDESKEYEALPLKVRRKLCGRV